jgi:hypothetical protein
MMKLKGKITDNDSLNSFGTIVRDGKSTIAEVRVTVGDTLYCAVGSSHRASGDVTDNNTGDLLAISRALDNLVHELHKDTKKIH